MVPSPVKGIPGKQHAENGGKKGCELVCSNVGYLEDSGVKGSVDTSPIQPIVDDKVQIGQVTDLKTADRLDLCNDCSTSEGMHKLTDVSI